MEVGKPLAETVGSSSVKLPPARKPRLAVLLPMVWSVRNVVFSGVLERLSNEGIEVDLVIPDAGLEWAKAARDHFVKVRQCVRLIPMQSRRLWGKSFLDSVLVSAFSRHHRIGSYPLYQRWFNRHDPPRERARKWVVQNIGALLSRQRSCVALSRYLERRYRTKHDLEPYKAQLRELAPDLVWSTVCVSSLEYPYLLAARDLGLPRLASILSFDNLTSRGMIPTFDYYCVWNERMRDQVLAFYPDIRPHQVAITGTPQFDFHRRPDLVWPKEKLLSQLGLPEGTRYVVYTCSAESLAPEEPELVTQLALRMAAEPRLRDLGLVVRLHPLNLPERWSCHTRWPSRAVLSVPTMRQSDRGAWPAWSMEDQKVLVNTLAHAEACVNIASTTTLDAALLDRPAIGLDFRQETESPQGLMFSEYDADHYAPLVRSGGMQLARRWEELWDLLVDARTHPERHRAARKTMALTECGVTDGRAGDRLVEAISGFLRRSV